MAVYCNNKKCPVVSMAGINETRAHGKAVKCIGCGRPVSKKKGK